MKVSYKTDATTTSRSLPTLGPHVGEAVGLELGSTDGLLVGLIDGEAVEEFVGRGVGSPSR